MEVGILQIFQNYQGKKRDDEVVADELFIAKQADQLGFDKIWAAEHHFTDYSACPDNFTYLAMLAGCTENAKLGTGAVIVPWNDPLRVAEKIAFLDHLSNGRLVVGLGRGLARVEYEHFGIDMGESRERFDEAARMILDALDTGFIEGDGPFYPQVRTEIRPRPREGVRDRLYCVGMSPESVDQAALLGARLMTFTQGPWEIYADGPLKQWQALYREHHGAPPPPLTGDLMYCHPDVKVAEERGIDAMSEYFLTIVKHYEIMSDHFKTTKGYDAYASAAEAFKAVGLETAARTYCGVNCWGDPERTLEQLRWRRELIGDFELNVIAYYGSMTREEALASLELFAREVLPEVQSW